MSAVVRARRAPWVALGAAGLALATAPRGRALAQPAPPPRCTAAQLALRVVTDGAAGHVGAALYVQNRGAGACALPGVPDVALVDGRGRTIQSTERARVHAPNAQPVVLAPGAWARAELGIIASTVCGGDRSDLLVLTLAPRQRARLAFRNGGPVHRGQCAGRELAPHTRPHPGQLAAEPFESSNAPPDD